MRFTFAAIAALTLALSASPIAAKESLGVFSAWGAFRDTEVPRCYAIAVPRNGRGSTQAVPTAFASVGTWPQSQVRGQPSFRLSRPVSETPNIRLTIGDRSFDLEGNGVDVWSAGPGDDAAIVAAMRAASNMRISASDRQGRRFTDSYSLEGAATAMDAASVGCARI